MLELQASSDAAAWGWVRRIEFVQDASGIVAGAGAAAGGAAYHTVSNSFVSPLHVDPGGSRRYSSGRGGVEEST